MTALGTEGNQHTLVSTEGHSPWSQIPDSKWMRYHLSVAFCSRRVNLWFCESQSLEIFLEAESTVSCFQFLNQEYVILCLWIHFCFQMLSNYFVPVYFVLLWFGLYSHWTMTDAMGQNFSHLHCILTHYKDTGAMDHLLQHWVAIFFILNSQHRGTFYFHRLLKGKNKEFWKSTLFILRALLCKQERSQGDKKQHEPSCLQTTSRLHPSWWHQIPG